MTTNDRIRKAIEDFRFAQNEMMRPEEDVVLLSACFSMKSSIRGFLEAYLSSVGAPINVEDSLETLLIKCADRNPEFRRYDLAKLQCSCDKGNSTSKTYCMDTARIAECQDMLNKLCDFVVPLARKGNN